MEDVIQRGKIAWSYKTDFWLESHHKSVGVENRDYSSPGLMARFLRRIFPSAWIERIGAGNVHSEVKFELDRDLDFEEGDEVELVLRKVDAE